MVDLEITEIDQSRLKEIIWLSKEIWLPAFEPYFSTDELHTLYNGMYNEAKLLSWLGAPENHLYIIDYQKEPKGYLGLSYEPDRLWLDKIYIHQKLQGRGLGAAVLSRVERMAIDTNISRVALRVNRRNEKAIAFYIHKGFAIDGEADFPAPGGYIYDDYLMSKVIA